MRCAKCNSKFGYVKTTTKEWQCRACGELTKLKDKKHQEEQ